MYKELYQQLNNIQIKRDKKLSILQSEYDKNANSDIINAEIVMLDRYYYIQN